MTYTRDDWTQTRRALFALKQRRDDMVSDIKLAFEQERDRRWAKTQTRYQNLRAKFDEIEGEIGEPVAFCEGCDEPIFEGEPYHSGIDVSLCAACAPSYADMLARPESFGGENDEPMTPAEAAALFEAHIANGGSQAAFEDKIEAIAHRWAIASYNKALGRTFEDIDAIKVELRRALTPLKGAPASTPPVTEAMVNQALGELDKLEQYGNATSRYIRPLLASLSPAAPELGAVKAPIDAFNGDNVALIQSAKALIALDKKNALAPHGIGNLARELLETFVARLSSLDEADLFWDDENPEESYRDVEDIFDAIGEAATYLKVRRAKSLPDAWVSCVLTDEDASDWIITYHEDEESARKTVQASRLSSAEEPQTDEMQPDKYIAGDFNGVVRGKRP